MLQKRFIATILICLLFSSTTKAQIDTPPTMSVGLTGLTGDKGSIDTELLSEIISEKQQELKDEFLKRQVASKFGKRSYALWEFMYNSLNIILESSDKNVIKKNTLESTTNLATVYGFTEFYLQICHQMGNSKLDAFYKAFGATEDLFGLDREESTRLNLIVNELKSLHITSKKKDTEYYFNTLMLDMLYDILQQQSTLKDLGLFHKNYFLGDDFYNEFNQYQKLQKESGSEFQNLKTTAAALHKRIREEISILCNNFLLLKQLKGGKQTLDTAVANLKTELDQNFAAYRATLNASQITTPNTSSYLNELIENAEAIYNDLQNIGLQKGIHNKALNKHIHKVLLAYESFKNKSPADYKIYDLYFINHSIKPLLLELTTSYGLDKKYLEHTKEIETAIAYKLTKGLQELIGKNLELSQLNNKIDFKSLHNIIELISNLDQLDQVETYEYVLQVSKKAIALLNDPNEAAFLSSVINNLDKFTAFDEEKKQINIAVEDLINAIYKKYANRKKNPIDFYFSLGINQSISSSLEHKTTVDGLEQVNDLNEIGFASEKIGLKLKLLNWAYYRSHGIGEKYKVWGKEITQRKFKSQSPLISDLHFVAYGSGLLYRIANVATESDFDDSIFGAGIGLSFFNGMDINLAHNWPFKSGNETLSGEFWTISFDIQITEYLSRKAKKKKSKS